MRQEINALYGAPRFRAAAITARTSRCVILVIGLLPHRSTNSPSMSWITAEALRMLTFNPLRRITRASAPSCVSFSDGPSHTLRRGRLFVVAPHAYDALADELFRHGGKGVRRLGQLLALFALLLVGGVGAALD